VFLIDDILMSPVKGFLFIAEKVRDAALEAQAAEAASLTKELSGLYQRLEAGELSEDEFDELEEALLDRLEALRGDDDEEEDDEDGDDGSTFTISLLGDEDDDAIDDEDEEVA